jgi:RNA polymerase sigma-70 factor (ECF subfamily)
VGERAGSFGLELQVRQALVRGDADALKRFFDAFFAPIHAYVARSVRDDHLREDLTQEVFLRIQRGLPTYRAELPLRPWAFTIASNVLRDHYGVAATRRRDQALEEVDDISQAPDDMANTPLAHVERAEAARATAEAVHELPHDLRDVLVMRHYQQLPFEEIATIGSTTSEVMRQRYVRALRWLRRRLSAHGPRPDPAR